MTETPTANRHIMWELPVLTQATADACVGYAFASAAGAPDAAERVYAIAKTLDRWPGESYYGTTLTAGAEAAKALGIIAGYSWHLTTAAIIDALAAGPLVFGAYWAPGMFKPAGDLMHLDAPKHKSIGHCAVIVGYDPMGDEFCIQSSWGTAWGIGGRGWLPAADLERLMFRSGEACLVVPA